MGFWSKLKAAFGAPPPSEKREQRPTSNPAERAFFELGLEQLQRHPKVERAQERAGERLGISVWMRGGGERQVYLHNLFEETRELAPEERLLRLERFLEAVFSADGDVPWEDAAVDVIPVIRTSGFGGFGTAAPVHLPFLPFVDLLVVLDRGSSMMYVTHKKLDEWDQSAESVLANAMANLTVHVQAASPDSPDVEPYDESAPHPIWHVTRDDSYESSRLALPGFLAEFRGKVFGNPIAIAPHRSLLVISGDGDPALVARLARMAEAEYQAAPRSLSPAVYTLGANDAVVPLELPPEHPSHQAVRRGHRILAASCYADQQSYLEKKFETDAVELFVAKLSVVESKLGEVNSYAVLPEGVKALLPEADLIALAGKESKAVLVPWSKFMELAPQCLERSDDFHPPRYRSRDWPDASTLEALMQHRVG